MDETKTTDESGAAMNARKAETEYSRMKRLAEHWEDAAPEGIMRFTHVSGGTIVLHKDGPNTEEPGWIKGAEFSTAEQVIVHVEGGNVVDVYGLPHGWTYEVVDMDVFDCGDEDDQERLGFKRLDELLKDGA